MPNEYNCVPELIHNSLVLNVSSWNQLANNLCLYIDNINKLQAMPPLQIQWWKEPNTKMKMKLASYPSLYGKLMYFPELIERRRVQSIFVMARIAIKSFSLVELSFRTIFTTPLDSIKHLSPLQEEVRSTYAPIKNSIDLKATRGVAEQRPTCTVTGLGHRQVSTTKLDWLYTTFLVPQ
ncbi:hypothetical protein BDB01DRAFT_831500 [Pilobolus umbonatus]|nr:hypothetical protein BDB01DRAFT_831500 [Pilobolus umbonatus]